MTNDIDIFNAIFNYNLENVQRNIPQRADVHERYNGTYLFLNAVIRNDLRAVQILLDLGADVLVKNVRGQTTLHCTSFYFPHSSRIKYAIHQLLLAKGANCNDRDTLGATPLHMALRYQPLKIVKLLLNHGADITAININGETAIHCAAEFSKCACARILTKKRVRY